MAQAIEIYLESDRLDLIIVKNSVHNATSVKLINKDKFSDIRTHVFHTLNKFLDNCVDELMAEENRINSYRENSNNILNSIQK